MGGKQRYDEDGNRQVVGCVAINENRQILLVSSRRREGEWILPKGGWELHESAPVACLRELWEEAGVRGEIVRHVHTEDKTEKKKRPCMMMFYEVRTVAIEEDWPERHERERRWCSLADALVLCTRSEMQEAMRKSSLATPMKPSST